MEDLIKLILFLAIFAGPAILKALQKNQGEEEQDLEARLEEAIRRTKEQIGGRPATKTAPPPVAPIPTRPGARPTQTSPPVAYDAPTSVPVPPRLPQPVPPPIPRPKRQDPAPRRIEVELPASLSESPPPVPPGRLAPAPMRAALEEAPSPITRDPGEAGRRLAEIERLKKVAGAYDFPKERKRLAERHEAEERRKRPPSRREARRMLVYAEILRPPIGLRTVRRPPFPVSR